MKLINAFLASIWLSVFAHQAMADNVKPSVEKEGNQESQKVFSLDDIQALDESKIAKMDSSRIQSYVNLIEEKMDSMKDEQLAKVESIYSLLVEREVALKDKEIERAKAETARAKAERVRLKEQYVIDRKKARDVIEKLDAINEILSTKNISK